LPIYLLHIRWLGGFVSTGYRAWGCSCLENRDTPPNKRCSGCTPFENLHLLANAGLSECGYSLWTDVRCGSAREIDNASREFFISGLLKIGTAIKATAALSSTTTLHRRHERRVFRSLKLSRHYPATWLCLRVLAWDEALLSGRRN
jgi:hypothetical protein